MLKDNIELIKKFVDDNKNSNGSHCSKRYYIKHNIDLYNIINNELELDISFIEKVWLYYNEIDYNNIKCLCCDNKPKFKNFTIGYLQYCSKQCSSISDIKKDKIKETNNIRYGGNAPSCSKDILNKMYDTTEKRYGTKYILNVKEFKNKAEQTMIDRYGVYHPSQSKEIMDRRIVSFKENIEEYRKNYLITMNQRYGANSPLESIELKEKITNTMIERYGVSNPLQIEDIKNKVLTSSLLTRKENWKKNIKIKFKDLNIIKVNNDSTLDILCDKCNKEYNINNKLLHMRKANNILLCTICNKIGSFNHGLQEELYNFISSIYTGEILKNKRTIIDNGLELDIYLPELKIAFEFNGLYWHSDYNKTKDYHINKKKLCIDRNIDLMYIWEDNWLYNKDIIKSMIFNKLKLTKDKIFARKCIIKELTFKEKNIFLNNNHIQGDTISKYNLGLFYNDELVMCVTLGKSRFSDEIELIRLSSKLNTNIIGGADKLLKSFIKIYKPKEIISYCLNDYSNGNVYNKLGFTFIKETKPNYFWVVKENRRQNRFNFRKSVLVKQGYDKNKTEDEIMRNDLKALKCYDSGSKLFKLLI